MEWDDIEKKAAKAVTRAVGEIVGERETTADREVERVIRELLVDDCLVRECDRRKRYDYEKAFERTFKSCQRRIEWRLLAVACMVGVVVGGFGVLADKVSERNEVEIVAAGETRGMVTLQLGNGEKIALEYGAMVCLQEVGREVKVVDGKVSYVDNEVAEENHEVVYNVLTVPLCAEYRVELSDGTKVWLNADSELRYPVTFSGDVREVFVKGEAFFEVAKDSLHPFIVRSGSVDVKVLGTSFNIRAYQGTSMAATLVAGSVCVLNRDRDLVLTPGQQCEVEQETGRMRVCRPDMDVVLAWKNGEFVFKDASLESIMEVLERYYGVEVEYTAEHLKKSKFYLYIDRSKRLEEVLQKLVWTDRVKYRLEDKKVILYE